MNPEKSNDPLARQRKLVAQNPGNELARFSLGKALYDAGNFVEALTHFRVALDRKPDWMVVLILAGRCELQLGNRDGARNSFLKARQAAIDQAHEGPLVEVETLLSELN